MVAVGAVAAVGAWRMPSPMTGAVLASAQRACRWCRSVPRAMRCSATTAGVGGMERMTGARSE